MTVVPCAWVTERSSKMSGCTKQSPPYPNLLICLILHNWPALAGQQRARSNLGTLSTLCLHHLTPLKIFFTFGFKVPCLVLSCPKVAPSESRLLRSTCTPYPAGKQWDYIHLQLVLGNSLISLWYPLTAWLVLSSTPVRTIWLCVKKGSFHIPSIPLKVLSLPKNPMTTTQTTEAANTR